jgi:hypothetical protein
MKKKINFNNSKLNLTKEKVAELSGSETEVVRGGEAWPNSQGSTQNGFTCCFCTTLLPPTA